jgi:predicted transcriptional regulator
MPNRKPKPKAKKTRLSVSLTATQKAALEDMAEQSDVSVARVIQEAVKEFIERHPDRRLDLFQPPPPKG